MSRSACLVALLLIWSAPASAQSLPSAATEFSPEGHIITRHTLADCKRQARIRKLSYIRQRHFVRKCVGP
jgi:hypothetical protein